MQHGDDQILVALGNVGAKRGANLFVDGHGRLASNIVVDGLLNLALALLASPQAVACRVFMVV